MSCSARARTRSRVVALRAGQQRALRGPLGSRAQLLARLADLKGTRADSALYWKSYAQNRLGQRAEALATIAELTKSYPASRYIKEAKALEVEVRRDERAAGASRGAGQRGLKLMAMQALQTPIPRRRCRCSRSMLEGTASPRLKGRALYVLAQINAPRAREVLTNIAKGSATPELQSRAIQYLGAHGGRESRAVLAEIYGSTTDVDVKRRILRAFMVAGEKDRLFTAAHRASRTLSCAPRPSVSSATWAPTTSSGRCIRRRRRSTSSGGFCRHAGRRQRRRG